MLDDFGWDHIGAHNGGEVDRSRVALKAWNADGRFFLYFLCCFNFEPVAIDALSFSFVGFGIGAQPCHRCLAVGRLRADKLLR